MGIFLQLLINGIIAGSIYALVASGFSLIYATNRFLHLAHGTMVTVSAYFLYFLFSLWGVNFYLASILTVIFSGFLGWLTYVGFYKQLKNKKASNAVLLISSIGLLILMENLMLMIFGADVKSLGFLEIAKGYEIGGAIITGLQIVIVFSSLGLLGLLFLLVRYTKLGKTMRAVADNPSLANILGINSDKIAQYSFALGSAIAGFAAILIALEQNIEPVMGMHLIIKGFTGAIIGGVTSLPGSVLGSYLLGLAENFGIWWLPSGYKDAIAFVLLFVFLLIKPSGILGIRKGVKE
ncbi:branched-chain amino acid ABC transporter permease [Patescibacteria group bacterium]